MPVAPEITASLFKISADIVIEVAREEAELEHDIHTSEQMIEEVVRVHNILVQKIIPAETGGVPQSKRSFKI